MKFDLLSALIGFLVAVLLFLLRSRVAFYSEGGSVEELTAKYEADLKSLSEDLERKNKDATPEDIQKNQEAFAASQVAMTNAYNEAMMKLAPVAPTS